MNSTLLRRWSFNLVGITLLVGAGFLGMRLLSSLASGPEVRDELPWQPQVTVVRAVAGDHLAKINAFGTLHASREFHAQAEISGRVSADSPHWQSGQSVEKGQHLLAIEAPGIERSAEAALADVARLQADIQRLRIQSEADRALLAVEAAQLQLIEAQVVREQAAFDQGTSSQRSLDAAQQQALAARAAWLSRQRSVDSAPSQLSALEAQLRASQAAVRETQTLLTRRTISAPFAGTIISVNSEPLSAVNPGQQLLILAADDQREVHFALSLGDFQRLELDAEHHGLVEFSPTGSSKVFSGRWQRLSGQVDPQRRQVVAVATLDEDPALHQLPLASVGRITLSGGTRSGLKVPRTVLDDERIWVVDDDNRVRAVSAPWTTLSPDTVIVSPQPPLSDGSMVVDQPPRALTEGMTVQIMTAGDQP